jgi:hypothetical protein
MPPPTTSQVVMVPVTKHEVSLALEDILTPLTQLHTQAHIAALVGVHPELGPHLQQVGTLASQLRDVISRINAIEPKVLASTTPRPA